MANLIAFIVLFGILVFVHELGHFLMAKYFKVGVERFALGFGPKLFSKKVGETEYIIAALPLGGYVKMVGDEPIDEQAADAQKRELPPNSFLAKPPLQRIAIVLMGPIANLVLPVALFFVLNLVGQPNLGTEVGFVSHHSPAEAAGIKPGDKIIGANAQTTLEWGKLNKIIEAHPGQPIELEIERAWPAAERLKISLTTKIDDGINPFGEPTKVGRIGINPQSFLLDLKVPDKKSLAYQAGFRDGDRLHRVQGSEVRFVWQIESLLRRGEGRATFEVLRGTPPTTPISLELERAKLIDNGKWVGLSQVGAYLKELTLEQVLPDSIAQEKGLQAGDILYAINGVPLKQWFNFQELVRANQGEPLKLTYIRAGKVATVDISPRLTEQKEELTGEKIRHRMLGVTSLGEVSMTNVHISRILNPIAALSDSVSRCYEMAYLTIVGFGKLLLGQVSAKSLGGPILIYQLAGKSWNSGIHSFIGMLVLISITLGVLNLLPIPVLDGGHLMFYFIELIKGSPVKARTREMAQQVGVVLLVGLMLFAFYNDLGRISWKDLGWVNWLRNVFS